MTRIITRKLFEYFHFVEKCIHPKLSQGNLLEITHQRLYIVTPAAVTC